MARSKSPTPSFFHPQPSEAEAAFLSLQPEIEALRTPQRPQVDVQRASAVAYSVVMRDREPDRLAWFRRLAEVELYDLALADIYQRPAVRAVIAEDRKHYDEHDAKSARTLAKAIFTSFGLGRDSDAQRWASLCSRAWTLLVASYDRHRKAGVFLFEESEDVGETYPSLVTAARRSAASRGAGRDEGEAAVDEGTGDTNVGVEMREGAGV